MTEWPQKTLGDLIHVKHGYAFKGEFFSEEGDKLVLKPGNFPVGGGIRIRPGKDAYYTGSYPADFELSPGDLLVVMTDLTQAAPILGSPAFVPDRPVMLHNQRLGLVEIKPGVELDRRFLYYSMLSDTSRSQLRATATGATVRHTAPERIYRVVLGVPDLPVQQVVGEVLGAFDDLVKNNRRRVEVLEEMARATYREWFVKFRYPGHEDVPLVDSALGLIPDDWEVGRVDSLFLLQRGFDLPLDSREPGTVPVIGASGVHGSHSVAKSSGPGVTTGRSGTVGVVTYLPGDFWPLNTSLWIKEFRLATPRYAFFLLAELDLKRAASGAAVPTLDRKVVHALPAVCPPTDLIERWDSAVVPMFQTIDALRAQSDRATAIRDLLLPKLVTGQIDVSTLDVGALVEGRVA